jgi:hypothetical protein
MLSDEVVEIVVVAGAGGAGNCPPSSVYVGTSYAGSQD